MNILEVKNLTKKFKEFTAVDNISFSLNKGEILGLLGPNGAGKTTTIQMLLGVLTPTSGEVSYFGKNLKTHREEILEQVNFSSTYTTLPEILTVKENLNFISYLYDIKNRKERIAEIIEIFKLKDFLNKKFHELSSGQQTRVNLAKALINSPKVLLLDEPTASLDPDIANHIRQFLLQEREHSRTSIIITSHNMAEIETLCDRVVFINQGKIIADNTPDNLSKSIKICHVELLVKKELQKIIEYCKANTLSYKKEKGFITIDMDEDKIADFLRDLTNHGIHYDEISIEKPSLEDYFLQATSIKTIQHETA